MPDYFFIKYDGNEIKVTPIQTGQDLYYFVELPTGTKTMDLYLEGDEPVWGFQDEGITEESREIGRLIEQKEA